MSNSKIVFCDTGFVIRLLDRTSELHENARGYTPMQPFCVARIILQEIIKKR